MRLVAVPAALTFGVTILRLLGELNNWSPRFFSREGGGGGALVGIFWFPFILGPYFAWKLCRSGKGPANSRRALLFTILGIILAIGGGFVVVTGSGMGEPHKVVITMVVGFAMMAISALTQRPGWPTLFRTLVAYSLAARIPVALLMFLAMRGNWETHYDGAPPGFPNTISFATRYMVLALLPQLTFWVAYTVLTGALFGALATALQGWNSQTSSVTQESAERFTHP